MIPNLRHLRAFCEVARHRSISQAAEQIHLSQPAITQAIAKLEQQFETTLFDRRSDGMYPTEGGQILHDRVLRAVEQVRHGAREATRLGGERTARRAGNPELKLTTTQLRALTAVADARNFSLAARQLGTSQPSLHRAARDLERALEVTLFEKTGQGIELTRAAQMLVQQVKLAFAELRQGFTELAALRGQETGMIVVGSMPLARSFILPNAINQLLAARPELQVSVLDGPYPDLLDGLRHGDIDLLIGALRDPVPMDDVIQEALFDDPLAIVVRKDHPLTRARRIDARELGKYGWVLPRRGAPTRSYFESLFTREEQPLPTSIIESASLVLNRGLLLNSDRASILSAHQVRLEQDLGLLVAIDMGSARASRTIGLTLRRDWRPTASQAMFLDMLREIGRHALDR